MVLMIAGTALVTIDALKTGESVENDEIKREEHPVYDRRMGSGTMKVP